MKNFHSYGPCKGLTLFRWGSFNLELWYCPAYYQIPEHKHPKEHIELMFLFGGSSLFVRREKLNTPNECVAVRFPQDVFKRFTIPAGYYHWFCVNKSPLIFLNFSKWINGEKPTSASIDFELAEQENKQ